MHGVPQVSSVRVALSWSLAVSLASGFLAQAIAQTPATDVYTDIDQFPAYEPPAHVVVVDGHAWLLRDGETDPLDENEPFVEGDRIWTERGRVEILFDDGSVLALDEDTTVDLLAPTFVRLALGRVAVNLDRRVAPNTYRLDAAGSSVWFRTGGEYRVGVDRGGSNADARVTVVRGLADLAAPGGRATIRAGYEGRIGHGGATLLTVAVPVTSWDSFDRWVDAQVSARQGSASVSHLPSELRAYAGVLDQYGDWQYESSYGYVWYPRVAVDWYPYSTGHWTSVSSYGWTWVGSGRWAWPTHHYGRWTYAGTRWCWIPGRAWAPAWVTWATSPGYVAWSPLGNTRRSVFGVSVSVGSLGRGWTAVSASAFSTRRVITTQHRVSPARLGAPFTLRTNAPTSRSALRSGPASQTPRAVSAARAQPRYPGVGQAPQQPPRQPGPAAQGGRGRTGLGGPAARINPSRSAERATTVESVPPSLNEPVRTRPTRAPAAEAGRVVGRTPIERRNTDPVGQQSRPQVTRPEPAAPPPSVDRRLETRRPSATPRSAEREPQAESSRQPARPPSRPSGVEAPRPRERSGGTPSSAGGGGRALPRAEPRTGASGTRRGR
jgi:hypothetical protein